MVSKRTATKNAATNKKAAKKKASRRTHKVCNRCGTDCALNARACGQCGSEKFAPNWVVAKRPVNRQVSVEITKSNPKFGEAQERITLSKWWPGGRATYHLPNLGQWEEIERIINDDLVPLIGWKRAEELVYSIK